jgi:hypothetical protein
MVTEQRDLNAGSVKWQLKLPQGGCTQRAYTAQYFSVTRIGTIEATCRQGISENFYYLHLKGQSHEILIAFFMPS